MVDEGMVLTQETLDRAFEGLWTKAIPSEPSVEMLQEMALTKWLAQQPLGTASKLLDEASKRQKEVSGGE